jgi:hypothetical protein
MFPHLSEPTVVIVNARCVHLNRERYWLTRAQADMLDSHFMLEHEMRMKTGLFFNFNGTAGVWRRACIENSGGWMHDTLTEDLDLSYRAQLQGWRFEFDPSVVVPAELPADIAALKSQQQRWAKGSVQTARKLLPKLMASSLPARVKWEAYFHLTGNFAYPLLLGLCALLLPVLVGTSTTPARLAAALDAAVILLGVAPVSLFLLVGRIAGGASPWQAVRDTAAALVVGAGLSVNNSRAVFEGLGRRLGDWQRTPKTGEGLRRAAGPGYLASAGPRGHAEMLFALYLLASVTIAWTGSHRHAIPFLGILVVGFAYVGWCSWRCDRPR